MTDNLSTDTHNEKALSIQCSAKVGHIRVHKCEPGRRADVRRGESFSGQRLEHQILTYITVGA
jgi:hypothetical protein